MFLVSYIVESPLLLGLSWLTIALSLSTAIMIVYENVDFRVFL